MTISNNILVWYGAPSGIREEIKKKKKNPPTASRPRFEWGGE